MNCHCRFVIWIVCIFILEDTFVSVSGMCHTDRIPSKCKDPNETCYQQNPNTTEGICKCKVGYEKQNGLCTIIAVTTTPDPHGGDNQPVTPASRDANVSGSTIVASVLIPLVIIVAVAGIIVYSARRYQWLQRLRQLRQRRYDEVRIGQEDDDDDPPIA